MNTKETKLYVGGPMRGYKDFNFPAFEEATRKLRNIGYIVANPSEMDSAFGYSIERLKCMSEKEINTYTRLVFPRDIEAICNSDGIALLPGWHMSKGSHVEIATAAAINIPCLSVHEWLAIANKE